MAAEGAAIAPNTSCAVGKERLSLRIFRLPNMGRGRAVNPPPYKRHGESTQATALKLGYFASGFGVSQYLPSPFACLSKA